MPGIRRTTVVAMLAALVASGALAQEQSEAEEAAPAAAAEEDAGTPAGDAAEDAGAPAGDTAEDAGTPAGQPTQDPLGLSMGDDGSPRVGQTYTQEEHGAWEVRCVRTESGNDPCQLYQLLQDSDGNSVAEISIFPLPESDGPAIAGATIITPLETLLTAQIGLRVDTGQVKRYPFSWCSSVGCFSRVGFTADEIVSFRRGAEAVMTIRPVAAPDQTVELPISLSGFTAGYEAVAENNAEAREE